MVAQGLAQQLVESAVEVAAAVQRLPGHRQRLRQPLPVRRPQPLDQRPHLRIRRQQVREHRQQAVAEAGRAAAAQLDVQHAQELAVGAGVGDQRAAAGVRHRDRLGHAVVGVAAQDRVQAGHPGGQLQVHVHAVVRQQHRQRRRVPLPDLRDQGLERLLLDAVAPVRHETPGVGDRGVRKRLADHRHRVAAQFAQDVRREGAAGVLVVDRPAVEQGLLRQPHVLRHEGGVGALEIGAQRVLAVGEFPVPGHCVHAEQVAGRDHVGAPRPQRGSGPLPGVAAIEQQRAPCARLGAQAPHQRRQVREAAHPAVALGQRREIAVRERMRRAAAGRDAEPLQERRADQVRRAPARRAEAEVGVRLAEVQRQQLRVAVGEVQQAQFAERRQRVGVFARGARGQQSRRSRGRQHGQEFAPAQGLHGGYCM